MERPFPASLAIRSYIINVFFKKNGDTDLYLSFSIVFFYFRISDVYQLGSGRH